MNIGVFGGTFNPPHIGHLIVAEHVRSRMDLDKIIFIPSYLSPHKQSGESEISEHRLALTRLAITGNPYFECSDLEIKRKETSYTIDTIKQLKESRINDRFYLLIGMDNYLTFHLWKRPEEILEQVSLIVMNRPGYPKLVNEVLGTKNTQFIEVPNIDVSSSEIRQRVKTNQSIRYIVPANIEHYILSENLYI